MPIICPAILADTEERYKEEIKKVSGFAHRIQIDLTDGEFARSPTVAPEQAWWPVKIKADFHLMYKNPDETIRTVVKHSPHMVIVHAESETDKKWAADFCHKHNVKFGLAILQTTQPEFIKDSLNFTDHILIFSGDLGNYGGQANLELLNKSSIINDFKPNIEVGWDGGINDQNVAELVNGGIDVLNVGGYIQHADNPERAFSSLQRIADETGTT